MSTTCLDHEVLGHRTIEIADVEVLSLREPVAAPIGMSFAQLQERSMLLVRITSADGLVGVGESWVNYPSWAVVERLATFHEGVIPRLLGRNAADVTAIHGDLLRNLLPLGRQWGAVGPVMQAISGVNIALWDLLGRSCGLSIASLLGGRVRAEVKAYASSLGPDDVAEMGAQCRDAGFRGVKLRVGFGVDVDERNLQLARRTIGDAVELFVDANQAWSLNEAVAMAPRLLDHNVGWVEEPVRGNDLRALEQFHERTGLRVATGENVYGRAGFMPFLVSGAPLILQPDVAKGGGITEVHSIASLAEACDKPVIPHLYGGAVAYAATLQLAAACPAVEWIELDIRSNPLRDPLLASRVVVDDGLVRIPDGPGLGIDLDATAIARVTSPPEDLARRIFQPASGGSAGLAPANRATS